MLSLADCLASVFALAGHDWCAHRLGLKAWPVSLQIHGTVQGWEPQLFKGLHTKKMFCVTYGLFSVFYWNRNSFNCFFYISKPARSRYVTVKSLTWHNAVSSFMNKCLSCLCSELNTGVISKRFCLYLVYELLCKQRFSRLKQHQ